MMRNAVVGGCMQSYERDRGAVIQWMARIGCADWYQWINRCQWRWELIAAKIDKGLDGDYAQTSSSLAQAHH